MKKIIIFIGIMIAMMSMFFSVSAEEMILDDETKTLCNDVILKIYKEIYDQKVRHLELDDFDRDVLKKNRYGIYALHYRYQELSTVREIQPYEFALTVVDADDPDFQDKTPHAFNLGFPVLGLKFAGYQILDDEKDQFDFQEAIQKHGMRLWDHQQKYMPYQLTLAVDKEVYQTNEEIGFTVTLTNVSKGNIFVKDLNQKTLFFLYDDQTWGAVEVGPRQTKGMKKIPLESGQSLSKRFQGEGLRSAKELTIHCSYILTYKGVRPSHSVKIKVVD